MTPGERSTVVEWFAERMLEKLCEPRNVDKGGWRDDSLWQLLLRLEEEAFELRDAIDYNEGYEAIIMEAADVANFALMIADVCRQRQLRQAREHDERS